LKRCANDPCVFFGIILYVDDFVYFSPDREVEQYFENALSEKIRVDFMGAAEFFLGLKFD